MYIMKNGDSAIVDKIDIFDECGSGLTVKMSVQRISHVDFTFFS